ncbi:MAG: glycosyltransferase [Acidobacteria bacterium]|nr:MAG: glycosyltransferase [Acidobacteriota bacterium]GIK78651.1 MAG: glycosyl transferase family 1 [Actinomycetes bacterium]
MAAIVSPFEEIHVGSMDPERFRAILGERFEEVDLGIRDGRSLFAGRSIWHINSTARGGGVAELLQSLLAYVRGIGLDARWGVIGGEPGFFAVTKRIHNLLHGSAGDGGKLGPDERELYESTLAPASAAVAELVDEHDVVFLHDPQTAGMVEALRETGAAVVWRCHVGIDEPNELARGAWSFLRPYVQRADAYVFSRDSFVWEGIDRDRVWIVPPSIDVFSPKNQELGFEAIDAILTRVGLIAGDDRGGGGFIRHDGSAGRVLRGAEITQEMPIPDGAPLATQVSRWDRLKDPVGVLRGFAGQLDGGDPHLLLAGPAAAAVADDPEGADVLAEVLEAREALGPEVRARTHIACLPMDDVEENAAMVNAIQRRSEIVVQKSLAEGFGLTVAEAMWKAKPVVASARGGIQDQIESGVSGILLPDPADLEAFGRAVRRLIDDEALRLRIGLAARRRIESDFLGTRHLMQYLEFLRALLAKRAKA